jgi:hypothetical protein
MVRVKNCKFQGSDDRFDRQRIEMFEQDWGVPGVPYLTNWTPSCVICSPPLVCQVQKHAFDVRVIRHRFPIDHMPHQ